MPGLEDVWYFWPFYLFLIGGIPFILFVGGMLFYFIGVGLLSPANGLDQLDRQFGYRYDVDQEDD